MPDTHIPNINTYFLTRTTRPTADFCQRPFSAAACCRLLSRRDAVRLECASRLWMMRWSWWAGGTLRLTPPVIGAWMCVKGWMTTTCVKASRGRKTKKGLYKSIYHFTSQAHVYANIQMTTRATHQHIPSEDWRTDQWLASACVTDGSIDSATCHREPEGVWTRASSSGFIRQRYRKLGWMSQLGRKITPLLGPLKTPNAKK